MMNIILKLRIYMKTISIDNRFYTAGHFIQKPNGLNNWIVFHNYKLTYFKPEGVIGWKVDSYIASIRLKLTNSEYQ